ncbi:MAG: hypothetical protein KDC80_23200 [Saprospiraceae bacterium]|nr:hypothetical protein [Saprospiraceae bacterium]
MIKYFRKIRQNLLSEGRTTKYLKYATGEIILVVIGILIALWINNWNQDRQLKNLETKYLKEIKSSLEFDLIDIDFNIDFNENRLKSNEIILQYVRQEINYADSLSKHFGNLIFTTRTLPNSSAYENLKNKGIEVISKDSLRQELTKLYSFYFFNARDFEMQDDHYFQHQTFVPIVTKVIEIIEVWENGDPINENSLITNVEFKNALVINIKLRKEMIRMYKQLKQKVQSCLKQIDNELK